MSRMRTTIGIALVTALGACGDTREQAPLVGTLERERIEIIAEAAEPIVAVDVAEGEHVTRGQVLVRQDTELTRAREAQSQALVEEARHRLDELENGARAENVAEARARLAAARAAAERDALEFKRVEEIVRRELLAAAELDAARAARDRSGAAVREAQAQLDLLLHGTRAEQLAQGRAALAAAESQLRAQQLSDARLVVRATRDGLVEALPFEVGERPPVGAPVAVLLADGQPYARIYVPEPMLARVRPGTRVSVHVDGVQAGLTGVVRYVAGSASFTPYYALTQRDRSRLSFLAEVTLEGEGALRLPAGVPVEVRLDGAAADGSGRG
jgi:HlyD family secretion protein